MKRIIAILLAIVLVFTGCSSTYDEPLEMYAPLLLYHPDTKIIYISNGSRMAPYYSENGKLCRWIEGEIVEVTDDGKENE